MLQTNSNRGRKAFTLPELLVLLGIVGILVSLMLSAVIRAREAANRLACCNNLRQLAIAVTCYHDVKGRLPVNSLPTPKGPYGSTTKSWSWIARILPHVEQGSAYRQAGIPFATLLKAEDVVKLQLAILSCPSDSAGTAGPRADEKNLGDLFPPTILAGTTNYKGVSGANWQWGDPLWHNPGTNGSWDGLNRGDGMFYRYDWRFPKALSAVRDGLSSTLMIGEDVPDLNHWFAWSHANGSVATCAIALNASALTGKTYSPTDYTNVYSFKSRHVAGAHFASADGAVHFLSNSVPLPIYRALATIHGGEVAIHP